MGTYFLDTSAIVKRYVPAEQGYAWVAALCYPAQGHKLFINPNDYRQATPVIETLALNLRYISSVVSGAFGTFVEETQGR